MQGLRNWAVVLLVACLTAACATADVSGVRVPGAAASAVRFSSVDVVFIDTTAVKRTDLGAVFASPGSYAALSDRVALDVRRAMSEARDGVRAALVEQGIAGRTYLVSDANGVATSPSHQVVISLVSAQATAQNTGAIHLRVTVVEAASRRPLWQGDSKTFPGGDGFSQAARDDAVRKKQRAFGDGIVRALREAGLWT